MLLLLDRQSLSPVFEVCEKSFSRIWLAFDSTRAHASHTRLTLFLRSVEFVTFSSTIPPRRPCSPQPNSGSWKLSEKSQFSTVQPSPSSIRRPVSQPFALRFLRVTF